MRAVRWLAAAVLGLAGLAGLGEAVLRLAGFGHPILYDNRAAYGYRPLPDQTRRRFGGARVHVNNLGLRGADVTPERPPGALRILFLGDSVTWGGSYVDDAQLFATIAADTVRRQHPGRFTAVEALDAGVNGWGAENIAGLVGAEGEFPDAFGSDVWVLTILDDDFRRERTHVGEVPYFNVSPAMAWEELLVLGAYRIVTTYKRPKPAADFERIGREDLEVYRARAAHARARGALVLFVWHPDRAAVGGAEEVWKGRLAAMAADARVPLLDLLPAYRHAGGAALYVDGLHLGVAGHAVAGRAIGEWLEQVVGELGPHCIYPRARSSRSRFGRAGSSPAPSGTGWCAAIHASRWRSMVRRAHRAAAAPAWSRRWRARWGAARAGRARAGRAG